MSRRDLSLIGMGNQAEYDTFPHTRAALAASRNIEPLTSYTRSIRGVTSSR